MICINSCLWVLLLGDNFSDLIFDFDLKFLSKTFVISFTSCTIPYFNPTSVGESSTDFPGNKTNIALKLLFCLG